MFQVIKVSAVSNHGDLATTNGLPSGEWYVLADLTMKETASPFKLLLDIPQT